MHPATPALGQPRLLARLDDAITALVGVRGGCVAAGRAGALVRLGTQGVVGTGRTALDCVALIAVPPYLVALAGPNPWSARDLHLYDAALVQVSSHRLRSPLGAVRLGDPVVLITLDSDGHPTDRSTRRATWSPPLAPSAETPIAQGGFLPDEEWHWRHPHRPHQGPKAALGRLAVRLEDGWLVGADRDGSQVLRQHLPGVTALASSPGGRWLYAGCADGRVLAVPVASRG